MKIHVKPAEGLSVPDPELIDVLPPEGREVDDSPYWRRRLKDKSVMLSPVATDESGADESSADESSADQAPGTPPQTPRGEGSTRVLPQTPPAPGAPPPGPPRPGSRRRNSPAAQTSGGGAGHESGAEGDAAGASNSDSQPVAAGESGAGGASADFGVQESPATGESEVA
jgi:hypothetical protein